MSPEKRPPTKIQVIAKQPNIHNSNHLPSVVFVKLAICPDPAISWRNNILLISWSQAPQIGWGTSFDSSIAHFYSITCVGASRK
jgi:hypothetical protein